ncbi:MAG: hypothetical protein WCK51_02625 [Armatimonadota bacterium]
MRKFLFLGFAIQFVGLAHAQQFDYPTRRALIANICPAVKIESFKFTNGTSKFISEFSWSNSGDKDVLAFELVTVKFDPFNRSITGGRSVLPGHNSAKYEPLKPGEKDSDGSSSLASGAHTYTAFIYVRTVRFVDGTIWSFNAADLLKSIKAQAPDILEPGPLFPEPAKPTSSGV